MKVCPNCGSTEVKPAKVVDEWASIEEQMDTSGGDKYECHECGYKGELIGIAEAPDEDEMPEDEDIESEPLPESKAEVKKAQKSQKAPKASKAKHKKKGKK